MYHLDACCAHQACTEVKRLWACKGDREKAIDAMRVGRAEHDRTIDLVLAVHQPLHAVLPPAQALDVHMLLGA